MNFNHNCFQIVKTLSVAFTLILILSASIGQIVHDRTVFLALLMYITLLPLVLCQDLIDG